MNGDMATAVLQHKNEDMTVYLDMDGVLVNFNGGFKRLSSGLDLKGYAAAFGEPATRQRYLKAGEDFWAGLEWITGGEEVWNAASNLFERVCILSSAGTTDQEMGAVVEAGKRKWLHNHIPSLPPNRIFIVMGKHRKQEYATRDSILVDDASETIKQWNARGGYGILHNANNYKKSIEELEDLARPIKLSEIVKRFGK